MILLLLAQLSYTGPIAPIKSLRDPTVQKALFLSVLLATPASLLALLFAIPSAYVLARSNKPFLWILDTLLDLPVILSPVALGLALLLFFRTLVGQWIEDHLLTFVFEWPGMLLAQFILALALSIRVMKAVFTEIDPRLEQVARFLGANQWQVFRRVTLPLARPGLLTAFVLGWARALGDFGATVTIAGAVPGKTETLPIGIYLRLASLEIEKAVAMALVLTFSAMVVLTLARWLGEKRSRWFELKI